MSCVVAALILLIASAGFAGLTFGQCRVSLLGALSGTFAAGCLSIVGALIVLLGPSARRTLEVGWPMPLGQMGLALDALSAWFLLIIGLSAMASALYSWGYFQHSRGDEPVGIAGALICLLIAGMILAICAADVVLFLAGWELMSLAAFLLVGFHHRDPAARRGAWMYLVATHLGTALGVLPVLVFLTAQSGSTSFAGFAAAANAQEGRIVVGLFALGLVGFGTKAGLMPMHVWLPEAHPVAPSPVSALMSGVVIKTGIYGLLRLLTWLPPLPRTCALIVVVVAVVTGVVGILYALPQRQYKRMLAYSSVENMGIIVLGIGLGMLGRSIQQPALTVLGFGGALLHVLNHSLFKGLLFLSAGAVLHGTGTGDLERLGGLARRDPANAFFLLLGAMSICALPPFNGFVSEFLIYSGLIRGATMGSLFVSTLAGVGIAGLALIGGLALSAFAKLYGVMFLGEPRDPHLVVRRTPAPMLAGMAILAVACLLVGMGAPFAGRLLCGPIAMLNAGRSTPQVSVENLLKPLGSVSSRFALLAVGAGGLLWLRRRLRVPAFETGSQATWGCGFSRPTVRMQYTGSSFVWMLVDSFRQVLRPQRNRATSTACFAEEQRLSTESCDAAVRYGYRPLFAGIARQCERLWPLQHGRIQLYLMYIVGALIIVFAVEAWSLPAASRQPPAKQAVGREVSRESSGTVSVPGSGGQLTP